MTRTHLYSQLLSRVQEPRRFIQVLAGPRQVGKTSLVRQVMEASGLAAHYASADEPTLRDQTWLEQQWEHPLQHRHRLHPFCRHPCRIRQDRRHHHLTPMKAKIPPPLGRPAPKCERRTSNIQRRTSNQRAHTATARLLLKRGTGGPPVWRTSSLPFNVGSSAFDVQCSPFPMNRPSSARSSLPI